MTRPTTRRPAGLQALAVCMAQAALATLAAWGGAPAPAAAQQASQQATQQAAQQAAAEPGVMLAGLRRVVAVTADGARTEIGTVQFTPSGDGRTAQVALSLHTERFTDHFLSMREFKCLPGGTELSCQVPYPYANPGTVTPDNLAWLEHRLLFFYKKPADFGAKLWNGVYYVFRPGPGGLVGTPQAIDLNRIAAPPARLDVPPYGPAQRDAMPADARWIRQIVIEP